MKHSNIGSALAAAAAFLLVTGAAWWAANEVSALLDGPTVQLRHIVAALVLLVVTGRALAPAGSLRHLRRRNRRRSCEH